MTISELPYLRFYREYARQCRYRSWPTSVHAVRVDATGMVSITLTFPDPVYSIHQMHRTHAGPYFLFYDPADGLPVHKGIDSMAEPEFWQHYSLGDAPNQFRHQPWYTYRVTEEMLIGTNRRIRNRGADGMPGQFTEVTVGVWLIQQPGGVVTVWPHSQFEERVELLDNPA